MTLQCPACGWSTTIAPRSDVLHPGQHPEHCPRCQHPDLEYHRAHPLQAALARLASRWRG